MHTLIKKLFWNICVYCSYGSILLFFFFNVNLAHAWVITHSCSYSSSLLYWGAVSAQSDAHILMSSNIYTYLCFRHHSQDKNISESSLAVVPLSAKSGEFGLPLWPWILGGFMESRVSHRCVGCEQVCNDGKLQCPMSWVIAGLLQ